MVNYFTCSLPKSSIRFFAASKWTPIGTLIEVSPVLFFSKEEYHEHGRHTALDHYTFKWRDGRMALALGLGSLFNHSDAPNVSYTLDSSTESIRYTTTKNIYPDEEFCIFYGHNLWFEPASTSDRPRLADQEPEDEWGGLSSIGYDTQDMPSEWPIVLEGDPEEIIAAEELPFTRLRVMPDEDDEEDMSAIRTGESSPRVYLIICIRLLKLYCSARVGRRHSRSSPYKNNAKVCIPH